MDHTDPPPATPELSPQTLPSDGGELVLRVMPLPADVNANGDIFGGWIMARWTWPARCCPAASRRAGLRPWR
jgi:acyl-CoA thioesterase YciA